VRDAVQQFAVTTGIALVNTLHTTCALFVNEFQSALIDDLRSLIERLVPERDGYRHDDRGCPIASAATRTRIFGPPCSSQHRGRCEQRRVTLGRFQSVIFAELDGRGSGRSASR